jgi:ABC-type siderophore export system fused ATPase/permease subunit|tara:strand:+ start:244 stop:696 length:453 start_codon:yes stop_codon:yes gene_type:complete
VLNLISGLLPIGEKLVDKLIPDPQAKQKALQQLKQMEQDGSLKRMEAEFADKDSARKREMAISTSEHSPWLNKIITSLLALGIVGLAFALFAVILFLEVTPANKDILIFLLGNLTTLVGLVCSYYFGSSVGSKDKTEEIKGLMNKKEPNI